jgi:hypothetical protein
MRSLSGSVMRGSSGLILIRRVAHVRFLSQRMLAAEPIGPRELSGGREIWIQMAGELIHVLWCTDCAAFRLRDRVPGGSRVGVLFLEAVLPDEGGGADGGDGHGPGKVR